MFFRFGLPNSKKMKSNLFSITLSSIVLLLGFSSCKKDCEDCFSYNDGNRTYTYCESDFDSRAEFETYRSYYVINYGAKTFEQCE